MHEPPAAPLRSALARASRWWAATAVSHWRSRVARQQTLTLTLTLTLILTRALTLTRTLARTLTLTLSLALTLPAPRAGLQLSGAALAAAARRGWARRRAASRGSPGWTRA